MKGGRTITVGGKKWRYRVGREWTVIRYADNSVFLKISNWLLQRDYSVPSATATPETFARGQWKGTRDGMITPKHVAVCIEASLRGSLVGSLTGSDWVDRMIMQGTA